MTQVEEPTGQAEPARHGLAARVSLGRVATTVPTSFLLILSSAILLTVFGLTMVLSATSATVDDPLGSAVRQGSYALIAVPVMLVMSRIPVRWYQKLAWPALIGSVALQLLVFVEGLGVADSGNHNWLVIGSFQMQPSEFMKLSLALWIAFVMLRKQAVITTWHQVMIPIVPVSALALGTVMAGNDLGTTSILVLVVLGCLFFGGVKLRIFVLPLLVGLLAVAAYAVTSENRMRRIMDLFQDECNYFNECFQATHGLWGLANGGIFGLGLGNSREKYDWLPAAANDYIFAIVGEELGLLGCLLVLFLFALYALGAIQIIRRTTDPFVRVATGGITLWIIGQAFINIAVVLRLLPGLGVPLPFVSQGGTSLVAVLMATGVLLAFARTLPTPAQGKVTA